MDRRAGRKNADIKGLEEEAETLLKDSDTQDSSVGGHCAADTCSMFRSRKDQSKEASGGSNKDVSIPLVRDRDSDEAAAIKRKASTGRESSTAEESRDEEAVQAQENKRRKRRIMKIAVYFMFGIIALGVFAIWLFHKDSIDSIRFSNNFVFTVKVQTLEIKSDEQEGLLYGEMGLHIQLPEMKAPPFFTCQHEENCLYWKNTARLRVTHDDNVTGNCYTLVWQGLKAGFVVEDCFYLQDYQWYGYVHPNESFWPLKDVKKGSVPYYNQYPDEQSLNLVPSWLGSQGISIFVHSSFPFNLSCNKTDKRQLCLSSQLPVLQDQSEEEGGVEQLVYTICRGRDLRDVFNHAQHYRRSWEAELHKTPHTIQPLSTPILSLESSADITPILTMLRANRTWCSFLQLPQQWEARFGDLRFHPPLLDELRALLGVARGLGCGVVLPLSTFFTYNSRLFEEGMQRRFFLRDELNLVTKMVQWRGMEGAVLDATNQDAVHWYLDKVKLLLNNASLNIQALKLLHIDVPRDANFHDANMTFLDYSRLFYRDASELLNVTLFLEQTMGFVSEPVFVTLRTEVHPVDDMLCFNTTLPWAFNLGVSGYSLVVADGSELRSLPELSVPLFKRWLQLATFFPAFQVPNLPLLKNIEVSQYMQRLMREQRPVQEHMREQWVRDRQAPIVRPLWWRYPKDSVAQTVNDQFLVGDRYLVAPVLCHPATHRNVYLPAGKWRSVFMQRQNRTYVGPKTVHIGNIHSDQIILFQHVQD